MAYLDLHEQAVARSTILTIADRGWSFFDLLDADHDGRLSQRELRSAWSRLASWDRDGDGCIAVKEVPRQLHLILSHGHPRPLEMAGEHPGLGFSGRPVEKPAGPLWFRKMDLNGDGDVSRREFLGSSADFRRIDADGDGLIDAREAERADAWFRAGRR